MKRTSSAIFLIAILFLMGISASAQETEVKVVDEVVAQVNEGVLTLSRIRREMKSIVDTYVAEGKSREEAQKLVNDKQAELIASLINEELILQKAKELGLEPEIDASINQRFLEIMKQQNIKTLDALYAEMEKGGVNPDEVRENWRKQAAREAVVRKEVYAKEYWSSTPKEVKEYYEKHKEKFTKPETITISEIFLSFAGRSEASVRQKAADLIAQLKSGADFAKVSAENSDRKTPPQVVNVTELDEKYGKILKDIKVGGVTDPIDIDQVGINILRVDARSQASSESEFNEGQVRTALMQERAPEALKKFMTNLRGDSYIKLSDSYRPLVAPVLFAEERSVPKPKPEK